VYIHRSVRSHWSSSDFKQQSKYIAEYTGLDDIAY
jgi:hypothetical protein